MIAISLEKVMELPGAASSEEQELIWRECGCFFNTYTGHNGFTDGHYVSTFMGRASLALGNVLIPDNEPIR